MDSYLFREKNPVGMVIKLFTGKTPALTSYQRQVRDNCLTLRNFVLDYVRKRKSGEIKSNVAEGADLLTLFLANDEVFTDTFIVDELLDFFLAGV